MNSRDRIDDLRRDAQALVDLAERSGRGLYRDEERRLDQLLADIDEEETRERRERDREGRQMRRELSGDGPVSGDFFHNHHQAHPWTRAIQDHLARTGRSDIKELIPGTLDVPQFLPDVPTLGEPPTNFLQLLGRRPLPGGTNAFSYLAEIARDQQAAPVSPGQEKPVSEYNLELRQGRVEVIAHLSQPVDRFLLSDFQNLDIYLRDALLAGIDQALQQQVLYGTGETPELAGLIPQLDAAVGGDDLVVLVRRALADLEAVSIQANAVIVNTNTAASLDLLTDTIGRYYGSGPFASGPNTLWSLPRLSTPALHEDEAVVGDFASALLFTKDTVQLQFSDSTGTNWATNRVTARAEGRFGLAVTRPHAFRLLSAEQVGPGGEGRRRSAPSTAPATPTATDPGSATEKRR